MLIILNGAPSIRKHVLACAISDAFKSTVAIELGGLTFKMHLSPIEVYNGDTLIYKPTQGDVEGIATLINGSGDHTLEEGVSLLEEANSLYKVNQSLNGYFDNVFEDTEVGYPTSADADDDTEIRYQALITSIGEVDTTVLSGVFAPFYINRIKADYDGEVSIINITRNPSVSYLMDDSYKEYLNTAADDYMVADGIPASHKLNTVGDTLASALAINALVKNMPGVTTVKFEDILINQSIEVDGVNIVVDGFDNYNGIITQYEYDNINDIIDLTVKNDLAEFNEIYMNLPIGIPNIYDTLNYEPLDYPQVIS